MDATKDYYAILGVLPTAEDVVIRAAYKALAQRYHPDRFEGAPQEAHRRMSELNEAYAVLSDPGKRKKYNDLRGSNTQAGDSYFNDNAEDAPPSYDPLESDWAIALKYCPDLGELDSHLSKISWRLAYSYKAYLLETKSFDNRIKLAEDMERQFLELYFGENKEIIAFARELIMSGHKLAAKSLNKAVSVLGRGAEPRKVIYTIKSEHGLWPKQTDESAAFWPDQGDEPAALNQLEKIVMAAAGMLILIYIISIASA